MVLSSKTSVTDAKSWITNFASPATPEYWEDNRPQILDLLPETLADRSPMPYISGKLTTYVLPSFVPKGRSRPSGLAVHGTYCENQVTHRIPLGPFVSIMSPYKNVFQTWGRFCPFYAANGHSLRSGCLARGGRLLFRVRHGRLFSERSSKLLHTETEKVMLVIETGAVRYRRGLPPVWSSS